MIYTSDTLLLDIDEARENLQKIDIFRMVMRVLEIEANYHSDALELPSNRKKARRLRDRCKSETLDNLAEAWSFGVGSFQQFGGSISHDLVKDIALRIEPSAAYGYRLDNVRVTGYDSVNPPSAVKVVFYMADLLSLINDQDIHPVDRSTLAHFHIARIHPFLDGNGRTARLLQNLILGYEDYAPATIDVVERDVYQALLRSAMRGFRDRSGRGFDDRLSREETAFFDYMGFKIRDELRAAESMISNLPVYRLKLVGRINSPNLPFAVKRKFDAHFRSGASIGSVKMDRKGNVFTITGLERDAIEDLLLKSKYDGRYKIY